MQRHKKPLEFSESPYAGIRHCKSPVLAAQKPLLTSSISAETLNAQWVTPQFPCESNAGPGAQKKCRKRECRRTRKGKENKQIVHAKENNLFPALDFPSSIEESSVLSSEQTNIVQRSNQRKAGVASKSNEITVGESVSNMNISRNAFLFSLDTPIPSTVLGNVLAYETPENLMGKRLRTNKKWQNDTTNKL